MGRRRLNLTVEERKERTREQRKKLRMKNREKRNALKRVVNLSPEETKCERKQILENYSNSCLEKKNPVLNIFSPEQNSEHLDSVGFKTNCNYCGAPTFISEDSPSKHCLCHQGSIVTDLLNDDYPTELKIFNFENDLSTFAGTSVSNVSTSIGTETSSTDVLTILGSSDDTPWKESHSMKQYVDLEIKEELENKDFSKQLTENPSVDTCLKVLEEHLSPTLFMLIKSQIQNKNKNLSELTYSNDLKYLSLNIFILSPKVYRLLQNPLSLPNNQTLKELLTDL